MNGEQFKKLINVLKEVQVERVRQHAKWGVQNHNPVEWMAILMEEVGEGSKEAVDFHFGNKGNLPETNSALLRRYREEMVQVAAVAVQMVESFDEDYAHLVLKKE